MFVGHELFITAGPNKYLIVPDTEPIPLFDVTQFSKEIDPDGRLCDDMFTTEEFVESMLAYPTGKHISINLDSWADSDDVEETSNDSEDFSPPSWADSQ